MKALYVILITFLVITQVVTIGIAAEPPSGPMGPPSNSAPLQEQGMNKQAGMGTGFVNGGQGGGGGQGPYTHNITSASSEDGLSFTPDKNILINHGSVPTSILTQDNKIFLYYVNASGMRQNILETTGIASSEDNGKTFTPLDMEIEGKPTDKALDPAIVAWPGGGFRLYYYASDRDPGSQTSAHQIRSAWSDDGIRFVDEGISFIWPGLVDPDVWWNGTLWQMYVYSISEGDTVVAVSDDGRSFSYQGPLGIGKVGTSAPVTLDDGSFRMYAFEQNERGNIISFRSEDGYTWKQEEGVRLKKPEKAMISDPSAVQFPDGTWRLFFKLSPAPEGPGQGAGQFIGQKAPGQMQQGPRANSQGSQRSPIS